MGGPATGVIGEDKEEYDGQEEGQENIGDSTNIAVG
jgi:hypothetical protein